MAIHALDAAADALVAYFSTAIPGLANVLRGWPEHAEDLVLGDGPPVLSVYHLPELSKVELVSPIEVDVDDSTQPAAVLWRAGFLRASFQLDLWAPYRVQRDTFGALVESKLHNGLPHWAGLRLSAGADYYERPINANIDGGSRTMDDESGAPRGEWRRIWVLDVQTDVVVAGQMPVLTELRLRLSHELAGVVIIDPDVVLT